MLDNTLYDILKIKAPNGGVHEELSDMPSQEGGQSNFARYIENMKPVGGNIACRHGTKEILGWFRRMEEPILGVSPNQTKITNIYYFHPTRYCVIYEKKFNPINITETKDESDSIELVFNTNNWTEEEKATCKRGAIILSLRADEHTINTARYDDYTLNPNEVDGVIRFQPILKRTGEYFVANDITNIRFIVSECIIMDSDQIVEIDGESSVIRNLGTRGIPSFATNSDYLVIATGVDPILVWKIEANEWSSPLFDVYGHEPYGEDVNRTRMYEFAFPVLSSVAYGKERFWGVIVSPLTQKPTLGICYTRVVNEARDWFFSVDYKEEGDVNPKVQVPILYLDLKGKHHAYDAILAITFFEDTIAFLGNSKIQLWKGDTPLEFKGIADTIKGDATDFFNNDLGFSVDKYMEAVVIHPLEDMESKVNTLKWMKSFEFGIVETGLYAVTNIGLFFISHSGVKIIAYDETFITPKLAVLDIDGVNQAIRNYLSSDKNTRKSASFFYRRGECFGFRFDNQCIIGHLKGKKFMGWSLYSGAFSGAHSFTVDYGKSLTMVRDEFGVLPNIHVYDDGVSDLPDWYDIQHANPMAKNLGSFTDQRAFLNDRNEHKIIDEPILIEFVLHLDIGKIFVNKYFQILADYFTTINTENSNRIELTIWSDLPNIRVINGQRIEPKPIIGDNSTEMRWIGDKFYTLKVNEVKMMIDGAYPLIERCKFVGNRFNLGLRGQIKYSNFIFKGIDLYGGVGN